MPDPRTPPHSIIAAVECRSEGRAEEHPVAVVIGGRRRRIVELLDEAVIGGADAGSPLERRLTIRADDGRLYRLGRELPEGEWRTSRLPG